MSATKTTSPVVLPQLFNPKEAATFLGVTEGTLAVWRHYKRGPNFVKLNAIRGTKRGGAVRYRRTDLEKFIEQDEAGI